MPKSTNIYVRIEPEIKEQAEAVLQQLGIPVSNAVNIFLKQVVMHGGLPFDVKIPRTKQLGVLELSQSELDVELEKGYNDMIQYNTKNAEKAFAEIRKDYGV